MKIHKLILCAFLTTLLSFSIHPSKIYSEDKPKSFAVLLLGIDSGGLGRTEIGRSDVIMIATVNPQHERIVITSIPRDSYVEIPGRGLDKINHAYAFGGPELTIETVENWLDIKIPYFVSIDMEGLEDIVDAIDGVEVTPPTTFAVGGYQFIEGNPIQIDGKQALAYSRERYTSGGDYARQKRQRQLILEISKKAVQTATNPKKIIKLATVFFEHVKMNIDLMKFTSLVINHSNMRPTMTLNQFEGAGTMINGVYYEQIHDTSYQNNKQIIHDELAGKNTDNLNKDETVELIETIN